MKGLFCWPQLYLDRSQQRLPALCVWLKQQILHCQHSSPFHLLWIKNLHSRIHPFLNRYFNRLHFRFFTNRADCNCVVVRCRRLSIKFKTISCLVTMKYNVSALKCSTSCLCLLDFLELKRKVFKSQLSMVLQNKLQILDITTVYKLKQFGEMFVVNIRE